MSAGSPSLVVLLCLGLLLGCERDDKAKADAPKTQRAEKGPALVEVVRAEAGDVKRDFRFLGHARPALEAALAPAVEGHVLEVGPREGDRVGKGDVLLSLDSRKARASLAAARAKLGGTEAALAQAERQLARVAALEGTAISDPEREGFELEVKRLTAEREAERAEVDRLRVELSQHQLRAPFAGSLKARAVHPGDWVTVGQEVLELVSLDELEIYTDVSAEVGSRLEVGQGARLIGPTTVPARIAGVVPALEEATRTMRVRLTADARPAWLLSGTALAVAFDVELDGDGVLVPRDALLRGPVDTRVMTVVDGKSRAIEVAVLTTAGDKVLVQGQGLQAGSQVIVRGNERLGPDQAVEVAE